MKRATLIIASLSLFFAIAVSISAATIIEDYPNLPACENNAQCHPGEAGFGFPQFIKYIYLFAIGIVGIVGLLAIIYAAFGYVTSAGNPQKASDAKDRIISALLGILLLLGSVVLLNLINPDLLKLKLPENPVKVDVSPPGETPSTPTTGCILTSMAWEKGTIKAGESVKLFFNLSDECEGLPAQKWNTNDFYVEQERSAMSFRKYCIGPDQPAGLTSYYWICTFPTSIMINKYKNAAERFYMEGSIKLNDKKQKIIEKKYIYVQDLKDDGTCCK